MTTFFKKVISPRQMEYLNVDRDFNIIEKSFDVERFADCPDEVILGNDVRLGFPELFGLEDILIDILDGRQNSFELEGVARYLENQPPLYIDLHFTKKQTTDETDENIIIFIKDVTSKIILEQSLVQNSNETYLQLNSVEAYKDYLDKILASMPSFLFVTNKKGIIKTINRATKELFGYSEEELVDHSITLIFPKEKLLHQADNQLIVPKKFTNIEVVCQTKIGEKISVSISGSAIQNDIEELENFIYVGRDITENQRVQKRQAAQYAATQILSESPTIQQATQKILPALCESLGWAIGEIWAPGKLGTSTPETTIPHPVVLKCVETWMQPSVPISFKNFSEQITFTPGSGLPGCIWATRTPLWVSDVTQNPNFLRSKAALTIGLHGAFGFPIQDEQEIFGVMIFLTREVQKVDEDLLQVMMGIGSQMVQFIKRKAAEAALLESEERYRDLFENASDLIQCVTAEGDFVYVNRAWQETLGYSDIEITKLTLFDVIHPDSQRDCLAMYQRVRRGEKIDRIETKFITKNGKVISLEGNINCKFVEGKPVITRGIFRDITQRLETEAALRHQREQSEQLLLNILPSPIADRLKEQPGTIADSLAEVTVMFADIVGFTELSAHSSPTEMVELLNVIFSEFDQLADLHKLEKIKTIGDAYMVVGGLPKPQLNHAQAIAEMALDMQATIAEFCDQTGKDLSIRIGINTGPVVAGVIGIKKFAYDLWGDTVNTASRMESHGAAGRIQVTDSTYRRLKKQYLFEDRGLIQVKGKGEMNTYFLIDRKKKSIK